MSRVCWHRPARKLCQGPHQILSRKDVFGPLPNPRMTFETKSAESNIGLLEASGGFWRLPEAFGSFWMLLEASGFWRLLEASGGFWRLLESFWRLLEASEGFRRLLEASGGFGGFWRLLVASGGFWRLLEASAGRLAGRLEGSQRLAWNARTPLILARQAGTPQNARSPAQAKIDHHGTPWNATTKTITEIQKCGTPENARTHRRNATFQMPARPGHGRNPPARPAQSSCMARSILRAVLVQARWPICRSRRLSYNIVIAQKIDLNIVRYRYRFARSNKIS